MACKACGKESLGYCLYEIKETEYYKRFVTVCDECVDKKFEIAPCGSKVVRAWSGVITCPHGYHYKVKCQFENNKAELFYKFVKRNWWSFLFSKKHPTE